MSPKVHRRHMSASELLFPTVWRLWQVWDPAKGYIVGKVPASLPEDVPTLRFWVRDGVHYSTVVVDASKQHKVMQTWRREFRLPWRKAGPPKSSR